MEYITKGILLVCLIITILIYIWKIIGGVIAYWKLINNDAYIVDTMKVIYPGRSEKNFKFFIRLAIAEHFIIFYGAVASLIFIFL